MWITVGSKVWDICSFIKNNIYQKPSNKLHILSKSTKIEKKKNRSTKVISNVINVNNLGI